MIIIRKFQPSDFQWIIDIERRVFNQHDPYLYMKFYELYPDTFVVANINGFIVGYVVGFETKEGTGRIFSLAVHPSYQNKNIGSLLLKEIIRLFREMGILEIILEVRYDNEKAIKFYKKNGFFQFGIAEKYYDDAQDACLMKLILS